MKKNKEYYVNEITKLANECDLLHWSTSYLTNQIELYKGTDKCYEDVLLDLNYFNNYYNSLKSELYKCYKIKRMNYGNSITFLKNTLYFLTKDLKIYQEWNNKLLKLVRDLYH